MDVPSYDLMQLLSSFVGGIIIMAYVLWPSNEFFKGQHWARTIVYGFVVAVIALFVIVFRQPGSISEFVATLLSGCLIGMVLAPFILRHRKTRQEKIQQINNPPL